MNPAVTDYIHSLDEQDRAICERLQSDITANLSGADNKVWHAHPVWFLDGNPIVGFSKLKAGVRLMFWSGADFNEPDLNPGTGKFKDASVIYRSADEIDRDSLKRWLKKSKTIQWDYKNIVKRQGKLEKI
jgi:hypothetical protein